MMGRALIAERGGYGLDCCCGSGLGATSDEDLGGVVLC